MGSCLIVGSAYHSNADAKAERANGVVGDALRAYANGRKDDWDSNLALAEFAIKNNASKLGDSLTRDAFLHRPRRTPQSESPTLGASPQPRCRRRPPPPPSAVAPPPLRRLSPAPPPRHLVPPRH